MLPSGEANRCLCMSTERMVTDLREVLPGPMRATKNEVAHRDWFMALTVGYALLAGLCVRALLVLSSDLPLYDGGLFYAMVQDLKAARYGLPLYTSYNLAHIPFTYPPLALYLAAVLSDLTPLSLLDIFRFLPLAVNTLTIAAFFFLARAMLSDRTAAGFATLIFALLPGSFRFFIGGGGLTRSLGLLFAVLTLYHLHELLVRGGKRWLLLSILCGSCAVLSHPEMALFVTYSSLFFWAVYGRSRQGLRSGLAVAAGVLALTAPWWLTSLLRHGLGPFLAATARNGYGYLDVRSLAQLNLTDEQSLPVLGFLCCLGILVCLAERRYFLPGWLLAVMILQSRDPRQENSVVVALLAGIGVTSALVPLLERWRAGMAGRSGLEELAPEGACSRWRPLTRGVLVFVALFATIWAILGYPANLQSVSREEEQAMAWVAENTPESSKFLIVTGALGGDMTFEWFPALTGRANAAPVQGQEWVGGFIDRVAQDAQLQKCANEGVACIESWASQTHTSFSHVFLPKRQAVYQVLPNDECCWSLREALRADARYQLIYDGPGATVFRRLEAFEMP